MSRTPQPNALSPELERLARRNVAMRFGWLVHAAVFVLVNAGLWLVGQRGGWLGLPTGGWIIGLLIHGVVVGLRPTGAALQQRMLDKERQRLQNR